MPPTDNNNKPSILKSTREAKGLSLEVVHEATKIPMDVLRAIEEGYSTRVLSPFYYRGFIKIYSEFLGLNVAQMYQEYGLNPPQATAVTSAAASMKSSRPPASPNVFLEGAGEWFSSFLKPKNLKLLLKVAGLLLVVFLAFKLGGYLFSRMHQRAMPLRKHAAIVYRPKVKAETRQYEEEPKAAAVASTPQAIHNEPAASQGRIDKVEVAVRAIKDTWIQVKADDKVVYQMTLNKGAMEDWSADQRIQISGRNLEQLDMEVNGKHLGPLGNGERRIRRVVITREGLTVKK